MEEKSDFNDSKLLIDLNSPLQKHAVHTPLIPVPKVTVNRITVSPKNNNPFDVVAKQTFSSVNDDPFDCLFKYNDQNLNDSYQSSLKSDECQRSFSIERADDSKILRDELNISPIANFAPSSVFDENVETSGRSDTITTDKNGEISIQMYPKKNAKIYLKDNSNTLCLPENNDSQSQISGDFSSEEALKAVIAKRVNRCIQKVLSNSFKSKCNINENVQNDEKEENKRKTLNRRSLSFISSSTNHKKCDRLNKSYSDSLSLNEQFILKNPELNCQVSSCGTRSMCPQSEEVYKLEDSVLQPSDNDLVFEEANKLARTFSKIAESFCTNTDLDKEEDLLSCKPRWLYADSSEDEEEKLLKDPALNIRVSFTGSMLHTEPDSQALKAFKSKHRLSSSNLHVSKDHIDVKGSNCVGCRPSTVQNIPIIVTSVPVARVEPEIKPMKLKKKCVESRKGPMKAIMPVKSMTKDSLNYGADVLATGASPPERKKNSKPIMESPNKDNSQMSMHPVASSTPNKPMCIRTSNLLTTLAVELSSNKRRSLGSTIESRKSRPAEADTGARQRSNSASSSIPTPVLHKPFKNLSLVKSPHKPRSTSSLTTLSSQMKAQNDTKLEKKPIKQGRLNFNPRALNEVKKSNSPCISRLKTAVNTISNLAAGKTKKRTARDKENRVPA